jgi:UDPglucose 6-dehydrogenase
LDGQAADLRQLDALVDDLLPMLRKGSVVVGKSTVPVGTAARLAARVESVGAQLVWNPEFLREGHALADTLHPDRIVVGLRGAAARAAMDDVYAPIVAAGTPVVVTDLATAELVKVAANSFLATKLSFVNMMARMCEAAGADVLDLTGALGFDRRIGDQYLQPGIGFGGGCLPKDIRAFAASAAELGVADVAELLGVVDAINTDSRRRAVRLARELCGGDLDGIRVAVLGAAFKPNSDDVRDSPALAVALAMHHEGAAVRVYDPEAMHNAKDRCPMLTYASSVPDACADADIVMHLTDWDEFAALQPAELATIVTHRRIVDGRCNLPAAVWRNAGWDYAAPGVGRSASATG